MYMSTYSHKIHIVGAVCTVHAVHVAHTIQYILYVHAVHSVRSVHTVHTVRPIHTVHIVPYRDVPCCILKNTCEFVCLPMLARFGMLGWSRIALVVQSAIRFFGFRHLFDF